MDRRIEPRAGGGARARLPAREHALLASLPDQLRALLTGADDPTGARARLLPRAYDDPDPEAEYRELMEEPLVEEKLAAIGAFAATLGDPPAAEAPDEAAGQVVIDLDPDEAEAWLTAVNDARLALGVIAGIETEEQWEEASFTDPAHAALLYLGLLQEELLDVLAGRLDA